MKAWMLDIKNEAQNMVATTDEEVDWWESLFGTVSRSAIKNHIEVCCDSLCFFNCIG